MIFGLISRFKFKFVYQQNGERKELINTSLAPEVPDERSQTFEDMLACTKYEAVVAEGAGMKPYWGKFSQPFKFETPEGSRYFFFVLTYHVIH